MPYQIIALGTICLVETQSFADTCAGGGGGVCVWCNMQLASSAEGA